jgi:hypothetical protein
MVSAPVAAPFPFPARDPAPALLAGKGVEAKESTCSQREEDVEVAVELSLKLDSTWRVRKEGETGRRRKKMNEGQQIVTVAKEGES